jgi:hypothetical protein
MAEKIESFVKSGGRTIIFDWASIYLQKAFPQYVSFHDEIHSGMTALIEAEVKDEELCKILGPKVQIDLSAGAWDPIKEIQPSQKICVLMTGSYEIRNAFYQENKPLAIYFPYGKGMVYYSILNEEALSTTTGLKLLDFFLDCALSI